MGRYPGFDYAAADALIERALEEPKMTTAYIAFVVCVHTQTIRGYIKRTLLKKNARSDAWVLGATEVLRRSRERSPVSDIEVTRMRGMYDLMVDDLKGKNTRESHAKIVRRIRDYYAETNPAWGVGEATINGVLESRIHKRLPAARHVDTLVKQGYQRALSDAQLMDMIKLIRSPKRPAYAQLGPAFGVSSTVPFHVRYALAYLEDPTEANRKRSGHYLPRVRALLEAPNS